jgi:uncharacterized CHY-type Zn-finger protein
MSPTHRHHQPAARETTRKLIEDASASTVRAEAGNFSQIYPNNYSFDGPQDSDSDSESEEAYRRRIQEETAKEKDVIGTSSPSEVHPVYSLSELRLLPRYILCTACRNFVSFRGTSCVYSLSELRLLTRYILCTACRNFVSIPRYILCTACRNFVSLRGTSCILIEILNPTGVHSVVHPAEDNKASQPLQ